MDRDAPSHKPEVVGPGPATEPSVIRLFAGVMIAPLAWSLHLLVCYGLAAHACFPTDVALGQPVWTHLRSIVSAVTTMAWLVLASGVAVAWLNWNATGEQSNDRAETLLQSGDGRSRFIALCGLLVSGCFAVALCFTTAGVFMTPDCGP